MEKSLHTKEKQKNKCFYSNLVNENMLRIEEVKIKGKYLELPFAAETSYIAGHAPSPTLLPLVWTYQNY